MPTPGTAKWPKPKSEDEFEDIVLDFLKARWVDPNATRNGRRGQRQNGVDIFGQANHLQGQRVGAQCKNTESPTLGQVIEEVNKAKAFQPALSEFLFVTAADRDSELQTQVRVHFEAHRAPFTVQLVFWDDVVGEVCGHPHVVAKHWLGWLQDTRGRAPQLVPRVEVTSRGHTSGPSGESREIAVIFGVENKGTAPAKSALVEVEILSDHNFCPFGLDGNHNHGLKRMPGGHNNPKLRRYSDPEVVVLPSDVREISRISLNVKTSSRTGQPEFRRLKPVVLRFRVLAEDQEAVNATITVDDYEIAHKAWGPALTAEIYRDLR